MATQQHPEQARRDHPQAPQQSASAGSLSQPDDDTADDNRESVAEEQNFDQQSDQARRIGHAPEDKAGAMAESLRQGDAHGKEKLRESIERAVPRGD